MLLAALDPQTGGIQFSSAATLSSAPTDTDATTTDIEDKLAKSLAALDLASSSPVPTVTDPTTIDIDIEVRKLVNREKHMHELALRNDFTPTMKKDCLAMVHTLHAHLLQKQHGRGGPWTVVEEVEKLLRTGDFKEREDADVLSTSFLGFRNAVVDDPNPAFMDVISIAESVNNWKGYYPRDVQLMAFWFMLRDSEAAQKGRLGEIATGEGKTLIVAMMIVAIRKFPESLWAARAMPFIDVITSSPILATSNAEEVRPFLTGEWGLNVCSTGEVSSGRSRTGGRFSPAVRSPPDVVGRNIFRKKRPKRFKPSGMFGFFSDHFSEAQLSESMFGFHVLIFFGVLLVNLVGRV